MEVPANGDVEVVSEIVARPALCFGPFFTFVLLVKAMLQLS